MLTRRCLLLAAGCLLLASAARAEGVLEHAKARGALVIAVVPDQLPFAAATAGGGFEGFDIDLAEGIGKRLGLPVRFVTPGWDAILSGDWKGAWDIAVASITPTAERAERLAFPAVYRNDAAVVVVHRDNTKVQSPADVSGKRVGVKGGTTFERYLRRDLTIFMGEPPTQYRIDRALIRPYPGKDDAIRALALGDGAELDAVVTSFVTARSAAAAGTPVRIVPGFLFWEPVAVAVAKGDPAFAAAVGKTVTEMKADGSLAALSRKWLGIDLTDPLLR